MNRHAPSQRRYGATLVELVAVMLAGAALMSITIAALVAVRDADLRFTRRMDDRVAVERLAKQLRQDIHAATLIVWDEDADSLTLTTDDESKVIYQHASRRWERRIMNADDATAGLAGVLPIPAGIVFDIAPDRAEAGEVLHIAWSESPRKHARRREPPPRDEVNAVVGKDAILLHR